MTAKQPNKDTSEQSTALKIVIFNGTENVQLGNLFLVPGSNVFITPMLDKLQSHPDYSGYSNLIEIADFDTALVKK